MSTDLDLTRFKALSFDCYGTLIDWESGIAAVLRPWAGEQGLDLSDEELLLAYSGNEAAVERETPTALYPAVLAAAFRRNAAALARLASHYQLIIVSNVHRDGFAGSNRRLRGTFAAIITAEDVGAYKPAPNHFRALDATLAELGLEHQDLLHVAQSLFHDHVPARRENLPSIWINRRHGRPGWGATPEPSEAWTYNLEFTSMASFADAVDQAFGAAASHSA